MNDDKHSFTLLLRPTCTQARINGFDPKSWDDVQDDYTVLDGVMRVGRIYLEMIHGEPKWRWSLQTEPAPPPNSGMANTLEDCAAEFKRR
jgi:hypothetical protein